MPDARFIASAAEPITATLAAAGDLGIPSAYVLVSYHAHGCTIRLDDRRAARREEFEHAVRTAFTAEGWGVSPRQNGDLDLRHPSFLRRP
ncbi:hypothetical protein ABT391_37290 [Streptomyces jumonjinensis]|uniref:hypothetical protein n=1 Tax=Streptomyces jumonjinensis TaxID=1945 RepID=UPI003333A07A